MNDSEFDFIIVGTGAGGAPLAARLAERGYSVLVLEAGPRHTDLPKEHPAHEISEVPAFHGVSTEHPELSWAYSVKHFETPPKPNDSKYDKDKFPSIFYPRATGIGGCTIHSAMIVVLAPDSDWDAIAELTGDPSWRGTRMRALFQRLEQCQYRKRPSGQSPKAWQAVRQMIRWVFGGNPDPSGGDHGFDGWLATSRLDPKIGLGDWQLVKMLKAAAKQCLDEGMESKRLLVRALLKKEIESHLDCNDKRTMQQNPEGLTLIPVAIHADDTDPRRGHRSSPRVRLLEVEGKSKRHELSPGGRLEIRTDCLVTRIIIEGAPDDPRASAVEYMEGPALYGAVPNPSGAVPKPLDAMPARKTLMAKREIILCGGAFNTPQLLMLSGIGDPDHLEKHRITCLVDRPGVGRHLQDRYEVTVISKMKQDFPLLAGATFDEPAPDSPPDPHLTRWRHDGTGVYSTNGAVLGIMKRSDPTLSKPDLFIFGVPLPFAGYHRNYSKVGKIHNQFTWCILKSHTKNRDGIVKLKSADPRDTPIINFHSFQERSRQGKPVPADDPDVKALMEGVRFVRGIASHAGAGVVEAEAWPGEQAPPGDDEKLRDFIIRETWGHHACGTCAIGRPDDPMAVLDSSFRVLGSRAKPEQRVRGLRVVDASVFPNIPGYFIVSSIYTISEKAADAISEDNALPTS